MTNWQLLPLGDCGRWLSGGTPRTTDERYWGGEIPWITSGSLTTFLLQDSNRRLTQAGVANGSRLVPPGTLLFVVRGMSLAKEFRVGIARRPMAFGQDCKAVIPNDAVDPYFLAQALRAQAPLVLSMVEYAAHGTGRLNTDQMKALTVAVPSLEVQRRIATALTAYDELIENNLRRIEILEEMGQAVYREWFVNFRFPGHEDVALVHSTLGPIPEGWDAVEMSSFTKTQYGYTASTDMKPVGPKFLRGMDFNKRPWIDWSEVPFCPIEDADFAKYRVHIGDVLVIRMADPGKVAIVEKAVDAVYASYVVRVTPDHARALPYWLFYYMSSPDYQGYISGAGTGTTRKSASAGVLTGSTLALPPIAVQEHFVGVVSPLRQLLNNLIDQNTNLRATRDVLLPKLVSGDIDISDIDIDTEWLAS